MGKEEVKSALKAVRRSQTYIKFALLGILLFIVSAAVTYQLFRAFKLPSAQNDLKLGTKLTQETKSTVSGTSEMKTAPEASPAPQKVVQPGKPMTSPQKMNVVPTTYRVRKGDSLSAISIRFYGNKNRAMEIARLNNIKGSKILIGQTLKLPKAQVKTAAVKKSVTTIAQSTQKKATVHVVKKGESLWKISVKHYTVGKKWPVIYRANTKTIGKNPNLIYPKQKLAIPRK